MNIIKKIGNKQIRSNYFNKHKTSYYIIRIVLLPIILLIVLLQYINDLLEKVVQFLGSNINKFTYFIYKIIHYKELPDKEDED